MEPVSPTFNSTVSSPVGATLNVDRLTIRYGKCVAVQDVTLSFAASSITAIIGPSGCGKTSLLSCFNRLTDLVPGCRVEGIVQVAGKNVFEKETDVIGLRRQVGMIFQRPNLFPMTIRRNLELPLREHGLQSRTQMAELIEKTLSEVGLWSEVKDRLDRSAVTLSGGQQQRLCLARALILNPKILLLDEPCSALDPVATGVVEELLQRLRGRCTLVVVTHNLAQARRIADDTAFLWSNGAGGRLIEQGPTSQLFDSPSETLTEAFLNGRVG